MNGGPSHVDTFDPKPALDKYAGKELPVNLNTPNGRGEALATGIPDSAQHALTELLTAVQGAEALAWLAIEHRETGRTLAAAIHITASCATTLRRSRRPTPSAPDASSRRSTTRR